MARVRFTTRKQREALLAVYRRQPLRLVIKSDGSGGSYPMAMRQASLGTRMTYRDLRRISRLSYDGSLMVPWCGMYLGIEPDGYTHS